jgi:hypothetical protein
LESKETTDIYPIYVNILNRKSFRNDCTNKDQQTAAGAAAAAGALFMALLQIHCTFRLLYDLNDRSSTRFDSQNKLHERRLYDLYTNLLPGQPLPVRISKDWQRLGFQGQDPATDFRGMGLLGLDQLLWFARRHQRSARLTLQHSWDESGWYTWACVGINITALLMDLLRARMLQLYLYSAMERWTRTGGGERWIETHWRAYLERKQSDEAVIMVADKHDSDISVISGSGGGGGDSNSRRRSAESETEAESPVLFLREAVAELYSFAFTQFDQYWLAHLATTTTTTSANPAILQFPKVFKSFKGLLEEQLLSGQITFESIERYFTTAATATTDLYNK